MACGRRVSSADVCSRHVRVHWGFKFLVFPFLRDPGGVAGSGQARAGRQCVRSGGWSGKCAGWDGQANVLGGRRAGHSLLGPVELV